MASSVELSVPNTSIISNTSKPYTVYNVSLRLPLRSYTVSKRFSDFVSFHSVVSAEAGLATPAPLPSKSWFARTISSPELTEQRRQGLEAYLLAINGSEDNRWRNSNAWKSFLGLPSNAISKSNVANGLHKSIAGAGVGAPTTDPVIWLDHYRELKAQLHDARLALTRRDQATTTQAQHENGAAAKKGIVKSATMIAALEQGLKQMSSDSWGTNRMGDGEINRRRDLVANARREREGLDNLLNTMVAKSKIDELVENAQEKNKPEVANAPKRSGRVLGKETQRTRALDNQGVVQLQQQMMQEQDEEVMSLAKIVARQRELGVQINQELAEQDDMLRELDDDVDRVDAKMGIARKRIGRLS